MINYIKSFVRTCSIYDTEHRETHLRTLADVLQNPIWEKVGVLKEKDDHKAYLLDLILAKDAVKIFEIEEKHVKEAPLALRLNYYLMKKMVRFLSIMPRDRSAASEINNGVILHIPN